MLALQPGSTSVEIVSGLLLLLIENSLWDDEEDYARDGTRQDLTFCPTAAFDPQTPLGPCAAFTQVWGTLQLGRGVALGRRMDFVCQSVYGVCI
jgi:hypothetical protein